MFLSPMVLLVQIIDHSLISSITLVKAILTRVRGWMRDLASPSLPPPSPLSLPLSLPCTHTRTHTYTCHTHVLLATAIVVLVNSMIQELHTTKIILHTEKE